MLQRIQTQQSEPLFIYIRRDKIHVADPDKIRHVLHYKLKKFGWNGRHILIGVVDLHSFFVYTSIEKTLWMVSKQTIVVVGKRETEESTVLSDKYNIKTAACMSGFRQCIVKKIWL